jgi:hypothetical protein
MATMKENAVVTIVSYPLNTDVNDDGIFLNLLKVSEGSKHTDLLFRGNGRKSRSGLLLLGWSKGRSRRKN